MSRYLYDPEDYDKYVSKFKDVSNELGRPLTCHEIPSKEHNLPRDVWFVTHCPNKSVKTYNQFLEYLGFKPRYEISKELATKIIYEMQSKLNRPLMYDDFRNPNEDEIGVTTIKKHWETMNKMKKDLGLKVVQEDMIRRNKPIEELEQDIVKLCDIIYSTDNRKTITLTDIDNSDSCLMSGTYSKRFKENGTTLRKFVKSIGFELQKSGDGLNHIFEDCEKTKSQYEFYFSNYLRNLGLVYDKDYLRDVKYKTFINNCNNKLDCDYAIYYKNSVTYIEIAGMLRDYKEWYLNNKTINSSKTKEKYRIKLMKKEEMFKQNNLDYYILFPSDLTKENLDGIFCV